MKKSKWQLVIAGGLLVVSIVLYAMHYFIFKDLHHIFLWSLTSLAFLPVSVLLVTLLINRLLTDRDRRSRLEKMNMVIGAFFSEVGNGLLSLLAQWDDDSGPLWQIVKVGSEWRDAEYKSALKRIKAHRYLVNEDLVNLSKAKEFLGSRRLFLLRLLENPNLLEHESFTALLRAVLHVIEELEYRESLNELPEADVKHLAGDLRRAYALLVRQWLQYLWFIRRAYPYLFSLAIRTNPFDPKASAVLH